MPRPSDPQALNAQGRYGDALRALRDLQSRRPLAHHEHVLLAEVLGLTGEADASLRTGQELLRQRGLSVAERCRTRGAMGRSCFQKGLYERGTEYFLTAIDLAERHAELLEECRLRVQLFRSQLHWLGPQQAAADVAILRRKLHQLADPALVVNFHCGLTELAAKMGLVARARKHLDTAQAMLPHVENRAVHGDVKMCQVALAGQEANYGEALQHALELKPLAEETDSGAFRMCVSINLGHLLIMQARYPEAEAALLRGYEDPILTGAYEIPLRDTMMQLRVAEGNLEDAGAVNDTVQQCLERTDRADSYFGLWHLIRRVTWLYRRGDPERGLATALESIPRIVRMADNNLLERMKLMAAEGMGRLGRPVEGAAQMADAVALNRYPLPENLAEAHRVAGRLVAAEDPVTAASHFTRAQRIMEAVGNRAAASEIRQDAAETVPPAASASPDPPTVVARAADRMASLVSLGTHAPLLARETLSLIMDTHAASQASIVETHADGAHRVLATETTGAATPGDAGECVSIALGRYQNRQYEVRAQALPTAAARSTLVSIERLARSALAVAEARLAEREQAAVWPEPEPEEQLGLICASPRMLELVKTIRRVAGTNVPVLITGETGVGKELCARALHQASLRKPQIFLPLACTTEPRELPGLIRGAAGGTLFLDEIGEMSLESQPKLLRFLESGEVLPLGATKPVFADVRVVAATSLDLEQLVNTGRFREDLFYRLNVIRIHVPPLRERREEIPFLVGHFLEHFGRELHRPALRVADETLEYLVLYGWPGNVRQLANEIRRMVALAEPGAILMPAHLSADLAASRRTVPADRQLAQPEIVVRLDQPLAAVHEHIERALIQRALAACDGGIDEAAKMLGLSRKGLYLKRQRLRLA